ncbi:MAG: hypothetical protein AB1921_03170 [Thermodesulfobacteriota bacterium]
MMRNGNTTRALAMAAALLLAAVLVSAAAPPAVFAQPEEGAVAAPASGQAVHSTQSAMEAKKDLQRGDEGFWSYAISTLIIRFVGIFMVLGILQAIIQIQGRIFGAYEARKKAAAAAKAS